LRPDHYSSTVAGHVFVDETKQRDYLLVAGVVAVADLEAVRRSVRSLVLPGQRRLHMAKEGARRRRLIASAISGLDVQATIYDGGRASGREHQARELCLRAVVEDAARQGHTMLVLEQDDSLVHADRRVLYSAVHGSGAVETLRYEHRRAEHDMLLALPDVIAWCWAKGGEWRSRIEPVVTTTRTLCE